MARWVNHFVSWLLIVLLPVKRFVPMALSYNVCGTAGGDGEEPPGAGETRLWPNIDANSTDTPLSVPRWLDMSTKLRLVAMSVFLPISVLRFKCAFSARCVLFGSMP